jgi:hypothetical protein
MSERLGFGRANKEKAVVVNGVLSVVKRTHQCVQNTSAP